LQPQAVDTIQKLGSTATKASEIIQSRDEAVFKAIQDAIDSANEKSISRAQKVQKWTLLQGDFTIPGGELGPTLKLRRHIVLAKYKETIDKFYE
jgi:long-chain-fatty-acid--CoA ligase ACSBG